MAFDAFLKIDGIDGESLDKTHPNEIEIQSYSFGLTQTGTGGFGGGGGEGKVSFQDIHFTSNINKASAKLLKACATGQHIKDATLSCRKAGGDKFEFLKIKLSDVLVSGYQPGGVGQDSDLPQEQFSMNFAKIDFLYTVQRTGEVIETLFDQERGTIG